MTEIDERYKRGLIYTIRNIKDDTMIYVGSTINDLSKRFYNHKKDCKKGDYNSLYKNILDNDWTDWYIELYENYSCNNKKELNRREGEVIREIGTINRNISGRTKKEYREENVEKIKEYKKKYREENVEKIKEYNAKNAEKIKEKKREKVCCNICNSFINKSQLSRHKKTKNHINILQDIEKVK